MILVGVVVLVTVEGEGTSSASVVSAIMVEDGAKDLDVASVMAIAIDVVGDEGRGIFASEIGSDVDNGEGCVHAAGLIGTA